MKKQRFIPEKYKTIKDRHTCPNCDKPKCFSRYFDTETGEFIADHVGICNRKDKCAYNYTGWDFIKDNPDYNKGTTFTPKSSYIVPKIETEIKLPTYIDKALFTSTLGYNEKNTLHRWLVNLFGKETALYLIERFNIGTTSDGKAIMWRIDIDGNILSSEIIEYVAKKSEETFSKTDCKRTAKFDWVHTHRDFKELLPDFNLTHSCFGEQYLDEGKPIYLVESAKTVLLASVYLPQFTWIACGSLSNFSTSFLFLNSLKYRDIYLMPDLGKGFEEWSKKAESQEMKAFFNSVTVDDRLQNIVNVSEFEIKEGFDISDLMIRSAPPKFKIPAPETLPLVDSYTQSCVSVENDGVAISDPIAIHDVPFWEETPQISDDEFKESVIIIDWFNKHLKVFDGVFVLDGMAINDIKEVIIKHLKVIAENQSSAVLSIKFLKRVKVAFMGA